MNKLIEQIADDIVNNMPQGALNIPDEFLEKFTQAIIKECQSQVSQYIDRCGIVSSLPCYVLNEHFGVES